MQQLEGSWFAFQFDSEDKRLLIRKDISATEQVCIYVAI